MKKGEDQQVDKRKERYQVPVKLPHQTLRGTQIEALSFNRVAGVGSWSWRRTNWGLLVSSLGIGVHLVRKQDVNGILSKNCNYPGVFHRNPRRIQAFMGNLGFLRDSWGP